MESPHDVGYLSVAMIHLLHLAGAGELYVGALVIKGR